MDMYTAIHTRRTIRDFQDRTIDVDIIERIIAGGLQAPTNDHMRHWATPKTMLSSISSTKYRQKMECIWGDGKRQNDLRSYR